jgi:hypothetical protein
MLSRILAAAIATRTGSVLNGLERKHSEAASRIGERGLEHWGLGIQRRAALVFIRAGT